VANRCSITETLSLRASKCSNTSSALGNVARVLSTTCTVCIRVSKVSSVTKAASPARQPSIRESISKLTFCLVYGDVSTISHD